MARSKKGYLEDLPIQYKNHFEELCEFPNIAVQSLSNREDKTWRFTENDQEVKWNVGDVVEFQFLPYKAIIQKSKSPHFTKNYDLEIKDPHGVWYEVNYSKADIDYNLRKGYLKLVNNKRKQRHN